MLGLKSRAAGASLLRLALGGVVRYTRGTMINERIRTIRFFYVSLALAICGQAAGCSRVSSQERQHMVRVYVFDRNGKLVGPVESPRIVLSDQEWQKRLAPSSTAFCATRERRPHFAARCWITKKRGSIPCRLRAAPLFPPIPSSIRERAGPASSNRSPKNVEDAATTPTECVAPRFCAPVAADIWVMFSTTDPNPPGCVLP